MKEIPDHCREQLVTAIADFVELVYSIGVGDKATVAQAKTRLERWRVFVDTRELVKIASKKEEASTRG